MRNLITLIFLLAMPFVQARSEDGTLRGIRIKTSRERGGVVENYRADNIVMHNVQTAISLDMYYGKKDTATFPVTEKTSLFHNIHLSNITAVNVEIDNFGTSRALVDEEPVMGIHKASDAYIHNCSVKEGTALFLNAAETELVDFESNRLRGANFLY